MPSGCPLHARNAQVHMPTISQPDRGAESHPPILHLGKLSSENIHEAGEREGFLLVPNTS